MSTITTTGLDGAKEVFQVHSIDAEQTVVVTRALKRKDVRTYFARLPPHLAGIDAEITALDAQIRVAHKASPTSRRLEAIPSVGPITAHAACRDGRRPASLCIGARLCCLARPDAAARRHRRQGHARADHEADHEEGQQIPAAIALSGGGVAVRGGLAPTRQSRSVAAGLARTQAIQGGGDRARQQDGADRLEAAGERERL